MTPLYRDPDGNFTAFICTRGRQPKRCSFCNTQWATKLCDFPVGPRGKTCDAAMCDQCATSVGPDRDHCPRHKNAPLAQAPLFGESR
jgi:hypothetical protein